MTQARAAGGGTGRKTAGDAAFSVSERIVSQVSQLAIFILAAQILGPAEFGVFALASAVAILLLRVAELGWAPFIMSLDDDPVVPFQILFVAILCGVLFGAVGGLGTLAAGALGLAEDLVLLCALFAVWVALANASTAQKGVLIWMGRIKTVALCEMTGEVAGLAVAAGALMQGQGVLALVWGRLACQSVILVFSFVATRRAPRRGLSPEVAGRLRSFSLQIFSSRMLVQLRLQFVTLIVGAFLGPLAVGLFRAAERLVGAVSELIVVPGQILAWSHLRRARDGGDAATRAARIQATVALHLKATVALGAPLFLWLIVLNADLVEGLLGSEWAGAAPLVAILALGRLFLFPGILTEPLLSIVGRADRLTRFMAGIFALSVVLTLATAPYGVHPLAWSQVAVGAVAFGLTVRLFSRHAGLAWRPVLRVCAPLLLPMAFGVGTLLALDASAPFAGVPALVRAMLHGLIAGLVYAAAFAAFDRSARHHIGRRIARARLRRKALT